MYYKEITHLGTDIQICLVLNSRNGFQTKLRIPNPSDMPSNFERQFEGYNNLMGLKTLVWFLNHKFQDATFTKMVYAALKDLLVNNYPSHSTKEISHFQIPQIVFYDWKTICEKVNLKNPSKYVLPKNSHDNDYICCGQYVNYDGLLFIAEQMSTYQSEKIFQLIKEQEVSKKETSIIKTKINRHNNILALMDIAEDSEHDFIHQYTVSAV